MAFGAANLITGMIWARIIWGIWWTWDWRLTSMLICWLLYAGYLVLRRAIEEPTQRARMLGRDLHLRVSPSCPSSSSPSNGAAPSTRSRSSMAKGRWIPAYRVDAVQQWVPILLIAGLSGRRPHAAGEHQRELDALRREAHAF